MDYKEKVKNKKDDLDELHTRMDEDRDLVNLTRYIMRDKDKSIIPNIINITLNDSAVFAANVESQLGAATEQRVVESEDKNLDTAYIEDFTKATFDSANEKRIKAGKFMINPFFDQQLCRRGRGAALCLLQMVDGKPDVDITPWDTRYFYYEEGINGLDWGANEGIRSKGRIESEIWAQDNKFVKVTGKSARVLNAWDTEHNEIWIDDKQVFEQEHEFGYTPIVFQIVPLGSMLADEDSLKYQGESIFFLIRDLLPELNRLASIAQTINMDTVMGALQWESEGGSRATPPDYEDVKGKKTITAIDKGTRGAFPVPVQDVLRAFTQLHSIIETRIQRGSLSSIDLGTLGFPLSAVALVEIGEGRDQVFLPRLGTRGLLNQQLADMIIDQALKIGGSIELGTKGHKRTFQTSKLQGQFEVVFKYYVKSPQIDAGRVSLAAAYGNLIPETAKRREVLQREDPDGDERQLNWEKAGRLSPAVEMRRIIKDLKDMDEDVEAALMATELNMNVDRLLAGDISQVPKPEKEDEPTQVVSRFGGGAGRVRKPPEEEE